MKIVGNSRRRVAGIVLLALGLAPAIATAADAVSVKDAWARATAPGQKTAGAYMELTSSSGATLVAVESPAAARAELHTMRMEGGVMKMRSVQKIELPPNKSVKLAPGGLHVMLIDVKQPLSEGDKVPLALTIESAGRARSTVRIEAEVRAVGGARAHQH